MTDQETPLNASDATPLEGEVLAPASKSHSSLKMMIYAQLAVMAAVLTAEKTFDHLQHLHYRKVAKQRWSAALDGVDDGKDLNEMDDAMRGPTLSKVNPSEIGLSWEQIDERWKTVLKTNEFTTYPVHLHEFTKKQNPPTN